MKLDLLGEEVERNFSETQVSEIMEDQNLSLDQKCQKLFDRDAEHVRLFGLGDFNLPDELRALRPGVHIADQ